MTKTPSGSKVSNEALLPDHKSLTNLLELYNARLDDVNSSVKQLCEIEKGANTPLLPMFDGEKLKREAASLLHAVKQYAPTGISGGKNAGNGGKVEEIANRENTTSKPRTDSKWNIL